MPASYPIPSRPPPMDKASLAIAFVRHEVVLVQFARKPTSKDLHLDVIPYRPFGERTFLADGCRTRIPVTDVISVLPASTSRCPVTGMLELQENVHSFYAERVRIHQRRLSHVWNMMPISISLQ